MMQIVILTGAGISAESGIRTFRDGDGLWERHRLEEVATPEAFARDPQLVHRFYNMRRRDAAAAQPNAAHYALAELAKHHDVTLVTQNVDALHERAGSSPLHMHGQLDQACCAVCGASWPVSDDMSPATPCPKCNAFAARPDIVWFGEVPKYLDEIWAALDGAELFAAIGTSGQVYPAAAFAQHARRAGAHCVELNLESAANSLDFDEQHIGPASQTVPEWVASLRA